MSDISEIRKEPNGSFEKETDASTPAETTSTDTSSSTIRKSSFDVFVNENIAAFVDPKESKEKRTKKVCLVVEKQKDKTVTVYSNAEGNRVAVIRLPKQCDESKFVLFEPRFGKKTNSETFESMDYEDRSTDLYWYNESMSNPDNSMKCTVVNKGNFKELTYELNPSKLYLFLNETDNTCIVIKTN